MDNINKIKDIAESRIRRGGFNAFSFRDIASEIGIKSSSVHYHFPTKTDLAVAVAQRYIDRFMNALNEDKDNYSRNKLLLRYIELFRQAALQDEKMCLCGALAAESTLLPNEVKSEIQRFFRINIEWLTNIFLMDQANMTQFEAETQALSFLSTLEGGMLVAQAMDNIQFFDDAILKLKQQTGL